MKLAHLAPMAASLALVACAAKPVKTTEDERILRATLSSGSALVTAGCVTRNQFGDDLLLTDAAARMAENLRSYSLAQLASAGVRPVKAINVLICPGHVTGESPGFVVKANRDTDVTLPAQYPIGLDATVKVDLALTAAYDALYRALAQANVPANGGQAKVDVRQPKPLAVTANDLTLIRNHLGAERLWVVNGATGMVSFAKSFATSMAVGMTTYITFGLGVIPVPANGSYYQIDLVDLKQGQRLWQGSMAGPGVADLSGEARTIKPEQMQQWAEAIFAPLISAPDAVVSTPAPAPAPIAPVPVPAMAVAAPAVGQSRSLSRAATVRLNPKPDGAVAATLAAGSKVEITGGTRSPTGQWWYVKAPPYTGWIADSDFASP